MKTANGALGKEQNGRLHLGRKAALKAALRAAPKAAQK